MVSTPSKSQTPITLSLDQSIEYAKQNSPLSRAARYALISAKWRYKSFRADLLPSLELSGNVPNTTFDQRAVTTAVGDIIIDYRQSSSNVEALVNQNLMPTGGSVFLSSGLYRYGILKGENTYEWQSTPFEIGFRQPLFQFNTLKWRNRTEPLRYQIAQKSYIEDLEDIAYTVTQNFFDMLLAKINVEVAEFNVTVNDSIYNISQGRFQVGNIAQNELLQSELEFRNARSALTTARLAYQRAEETFKALLGIDDNTKLEITAPSVAPDITINFDQAIELALANNSTSLEFRLNELLADQAYDQARKSNGFTASLQASFGLNQSAADFADIYSDPQNSKFLALGFQIPLFNWGKNQAEIKAARNAQLETANLIAYQALQFELSVKSTVREFPQLRDQVELATVSDDIATRRYDVAKNRYLIGSIDVTDLFIAQNQKDSSRRSYVQALRDYWTGYYNLRRLTLFDFEQGMLIEYLTDF